jgi:hypothetical protein
VHEHEVATVNTRLIISPSSRALSAGHFPDFSSSAAIAGPPADANKKQCRDGEREAHSLCVTVALRSRRTAAVTNSPSVLIGCYPVANSVESLT